MGATAYWKNGGMMGIGFRTKAPRLVASASVLVLLAACAVEPKPFTEAELSAQAAADQAKMFAAEAPLSRPLSLADAIAWALKHNLDHRTKMMEQALALGQTDLDRWELLPKVTTSAGYAGRSNHATTRSRDSVTQQPALSNPYYSLDRDRLTADLGLSWNILDFGVSYFNARQNADRTLIAEEHRRKTLQNLVQEVRYDYWRAAAAQVLEADVRRAVADAEEALADARRVEAANLKNPADILRFEKSLLENMRQLELISQEMSTAKVELAALLTLPPGADFTLDVPADAAMTLPPFDIPLERMEQIAFLNNPDLREQGYLSRISVDETRKTIARMLPGINLSASRQWDSNSFLVDRQWYEAGTRLSWNLINIFSMPDQLNYANAGERVAEARRIALRMAVLAQVHVSYRQFQNAGRQFQRADDLYGVENRLARLAKARSDLDAQSVIERIANQTSAIAATLRRFQTYAQVEQALGRVYATLGQDLLPPGTASADLETLSTLVDRGLQAWGRGGALTAEDVMSTPAVAVAPALPPPAAKPASSSPVVAVAEQAPAVPAPTAAPTPVATQREVRPAAARPNANGAIPEDMLQRIDRLMAQSGGASIPKSGE